MALVVLHARFGDLDRALLALVWDTLGPVFVVPGVQLVVAVCVSADLAYLFLRWNVKGIGW